MIFLSTVGHLMKLGNSLITDYTVDLFKSKTRNIFLKTTQLESYLKL